jgi:molybdate transport system ATP-binding protein
VQRAAPAEVARTPKTDYTAQLVGLNLYRGRSVAGRVQLEGGGVLSTVDEADGDVFCAFAPHAVALHRTRPESSARNAWRGTVSSVERHAAVVRVRVEGEPDVLADVTTAAVAELDLEPGTPVWVSVKATEVTCYPA